MNNMGYATLQVFPSLRDISRNATRQLRAKLAGAGRDAGNDYGRGVADGVDRGLRSVDATRAGREQGHRFGQGFIAGARSGIRGIVAGFAFANTAVNSMIRNVGTAATLIGLASRAARGLSISLLAGATAVHAISSAGLAKLAGVLKIVAAVAGRVARDISRITAALLALRAVASLIGTLTRMGRALGMITVGSAVALGALSALTPVVAALGSALLTVAGVAGGAAVAGLSALGAAAATVKLGLFGVGDAFKSMGKAATGGGSSAADTAKQVKQAQGQLTRAVKDERDAQKDVGRARDDARKKLRDLNFELRGAALSEKDASLSLREAQADLAAGDFQTATERERAVLRVQEAELRLAEVRKDNGDLAQSAADARSKGVEGSDEVVTAQERLADATRSVKDAQDSLNEARNPQASGGGGSDPFAEAMAKLSTNAQQTMLAVRGVRPEWENLRKSVQDSMFAGISDQVRPLADQWFPKLGDSMRAVAGGFNQGARSAMGWLQSTQGIDVVSTWMGTASSMAAGLGRAVGNIVPGLAAIGAGAGQAFGPLSSGLGESVKQFSDWLVRTQQSGRMAEYFRTSVATLAQMFRNVASVVGPALSAFRQLGETSAAGLAPGLQSVGQAIAQATPGLMVMAERLMPALGQALSNLAPIIPGIVQAFTPWATILAVMAPHIATLVAKLGPFAPILLGIALAAKVITTAMIAYNAVMAIASVAQGVFYRATGRSAAGLRRNAIALAAYKVSAAIATAATWAFGAALTIATSPITWIIVAIAALVAGLVLFFTKTEIGRKIWATVWNGIKAAVAAVWSWLQTTVWPAMMAAFRAIGAVAMWLWQNVIVPAWNGIKAAIGVAWTLIKGYFSVWMAVIRALAGVVMWLWNNIVSPAFNGIKAVIGFVWGGIKFYFDAFMAVLRVIGGVANWLWQNVMVPVWNGIKATIEGFWNGIQAVFGWIGDRFRSVGRFAGEAKDLVVSHFNAVVDFVKGLPARIANVARGMWDGIKNTFKSVLNWIIQKWNDFSISMKVPDGIPMIGGKGFTIDTPNLPMLAGGGQVGGAGGARRDANGRLTGPGTGTSDSIYGVNHLGIPVVRVANEETVVTAGASRVPGNARVMAAMNAGARFDLPGYAGGGTLPKTLDGYTTPDGINGGTVTFGNISGNGVTTGIQLSMWDHLRQKFPDLKLFSATRTVQTEGHPDFHNAGKAIDISPMQQVADHIANTFGSKVLELYWDPGPNMDEGKPAGAIGGHSDHVHWAMDEIIAPPKPPAPEVGPPGAVPEQSPQVPQTTTPSPESAPPASSSTGSGETSISGRLGAVAKSAVEEQVRDAFGVISLNDSPGWLTALSKIEETGSGGKWVPVKSVKDAQADLKVAADALAVAEEKRRNLPATADQAAKDAATAEVTQAQKRLRDAQSMLQEARTNPKGRRWVPTGQEQTPSTPAPSTTLTDPNAAAPAPGAAVPPGQAPAPQAAPAKKQIPGVGDLTSGSPPAMMARAIVGEAQKRGFSWTDSVATVSTGMGESGLRMVYHPNGLWGGIFQQDASYPGRDNPNSNIGEFFNRLQGKRHPDIWKRIFWLQQRPGEPDADTAFANGRQAYMSEIKAPRSDAEAMVRGIVTPELFDTGGRLTPGAHLVANARSNDETILPQSPEQVFGQLDAAIRSIEDFANGGGGPRTVNNFVTHATFRDEDEYYRQARRRAQVGMAQHSGGRVLRG
ncbi:tape measure protein [Gordonia phage MagicMan]|uniref:Tape measure protein n=1 Tax=Gordonia phage Schnabeltier TaxID=1821561 RepID=A0A142KA05_9CAUD|nr:tail length tape measure protein [Gordonia phage Schnabeltier]AMS02938.1 tape measure protein [Gordonia phage Schnabeltier]QDM55834.1 tape measure protein [Gordonia phage MagicMan]